MEPLFLALVWLVAGAHFAFLVYLLTGGFLALRWRRTIWLHGLAALWATCSVVLGFDCPLTIVERWARERAGLPPLPAAGFIDHYITGAVHPAAATGHLQAGALLAVLVSWVCYAVTAPRRRALTARTRRPTP